MMRARGLLVLVLAGALTGCISGVEKPDTYTSPVTGKTTVIRSDREMCVHSCNEDYSRCMETRAASSNDGIDSPKGIFGASGECRSDLQSCLAGCKGQ